MRGTPICLGLAALLSLPGLPGCGRIREMFPLSRTGGTAMASFVAEGFPESQSGLVASDIAERLRSGYPPGKTSLYLAVFLAGQGEGPVAQAVEDLLRTKGFAILDEPSDEAVTVAWRIDRVDERTWYLMVSLSGGYRFARLYEADGQGLRPMGLLSQGVL